MMRNILNKMLFPVRYFWKQYTICVENEQWLKAISVLILSLIGLAFSLFLVVFGISKLFEWIIITVSKYPIILVAIGGIVWLYIYVKNSLENKVGSNINSQTEEKNVTEIRNQAEINNQAIQGYSTILNVMYQATRAEAENIGGVIPTFPAEIEMPEEHYVIKNGVVLYQFKLDRKDVKYICDEAVLKEYCNTLQYRIRTKLRNGEFPYIQIVDFRDQYGNGMDGIVVDHLDDFGRYFVIYAVYASPAYSEYRRLIMQNAMSRSEQSAGISEDWNS